MIIDDVKLTGLIKEYIKDFPNLFPKESYKWKAVKTFQDNWDIESKDFPAMIEKSLSKTENLLAAMNNFPRKMIQKFASLYTEDVRNMFRVLFNESISIADRVAYFKSESDRLLEQWNPEKSHYQSLNVMSIYLWLRFPDKYYIYKTGIAKSLFEYFGYQLNSRKEGNDVIKTVYDLYDIFAVSLQKSKELTALIDKYSDESMWPDLKRRTMAIDFGHYYYRYIYSKDKEVKAGKSKKQKVWLCSVGENANKWEECYRDSVIRIGWDLLGNLARFSTHNDITERLKTVYSRDSSFANDSLALWEFVHEMNVGDVIYVKKGRNTIIGKGIIDSDYYYHPLLESYKNMRKVKWIDKGEWICDTPFPMKTLTELTSYKDFVNKIESLISGDCDVLKDEPIISHKSSSQYWWLNANPKFWKMSEWKVGEIQHYTLFSQNGNKRRVFQNFIDAKEGDVVLCYETSPVKKITTIARVNKANDGKKIWFKKVETLINPVDYTLIKNAPSLQKMEFLVNPNGSFFRLTEDEYNVINSLIGQDFEEEQDQQDSPKYTKEDFLGEVFMDSAAYDELVQVLKSKKNIILQGAPGVGKTFCAERLAYSMMGKKDISRIKTVQFHQSYSYEDFIMGYKPDGESFKLRNGVFYNFCIEASNHPNDEYFFIIDEINRGNLSKIFGELLMMIEKDYRGKEVSLAYSEQGFHVPENLYIIGMMNTADRSLALIDYALRRRFSFFEMKPAYGTKGFKKHVKSARSKKLTKVIELINELNSDIRNDDSLGSGFEIGHSYFCCKTEEMTDSHIGRIVKYDIIPTVKEYWFDNDKKANEWRDKLLKAIND